MGVIKSYITRNRQTNLNIKNLKRGVKNIKKRVSNKDKQKVAIDRFLRVISGKGNEPSYRAGGHGLLRGISAKSKRRSSRTLRKILKRK